MLNKTLLLVLSLFLLSPAQASQRLLKACDNDEDYPPFRWRTQTAEGTTEVRGIGHAVLRQIMARHGWRLEIDLLPLRRCLQEVEVGQNYQLVVSSSPSAERARTFLMTEPFDYVHFHSFYLRERYPKTAPVRVKRDLQDLRLCSLAGHNFSMFGVDRKQFVAEADNFTAAFQMLRGGRCDVLPYNIEAIEGFRMIGQDFLANPAFAHAEITDMAPAPILMLIAKPYRHAEALQALINSELAVMRASGELQRLKDQVLQGKAVSPVTSPTR